MVDIRVVMPNRPGVLKLALDKLCEVGLNIEGMCGDLRPGETWGYLHLLVEDGDKARAALEAGGFDVAGLHDVEIISVPNRPGELAKAVEHYSKDGVNIEVLYIAGDSKIVVGTENMRKLSPGARVNEIGLT